MFDLEMLQEVAPEFRQELDKFTRLCTKARKGKTKEVLAAVDQNRRFLNSAEGGKTLLMCACESDHDNPQLVQGLLERKARVRTRDRGGWDALMYASDHGNIAVCHVLLDRGADPDSNNQEYSALSLAASFDHLQLCQLFISRRANLMLVLTGGVAAIRRV